MVGEMKAVLIKDADHVLVTNFGLVLKSVIPFVQSVIRDTVRPSYTWSLDPSTQQITLVTSTPPKAVSVQYTTITTKLRDFRDVVGEDTAEICLIKVLGGCLRFLLWTAGTPKTLNSTTFVTDVSSPAVGWTGFYIQVTFANPGADDFIFATPASVLPYGYPFQDCSGVGCNGTLV